MRRSLPIDLGASGSPDPVGDARRTDDEDAEAKAAFHLRMRARGIRDLAVLRALELVPRQHFVPLAYRSLACRDLPIPIGCGQTLEAPRIAARMIEALMVERDQRVLEIGSGSGYATALLAQLGAEVLGVERFQSLASAAQERLAQLGVSNAAVVWGDGLCLPETLGRFDRVLVHGLISDGLEGLLERLSDSGAMICALGTATAQELVRSSKADGAQVVVGQCRLQLIQPGLAAAL